MTHRTFPTYKSVFRFYSLSEFCSNEMKVKVVSEKRKKDVTYSQIHPALQQIPAHSTLELCLSLVSS